MKTLHARRANVDTVKLLEMYIITCLSVICFEMIGDCFCLRDIEIKVNIDQYNLLFSIKYYGKMRKIAQFVKIIMTELEG